MENGARAPNVVFSGANVHIVSGSNATDDHGTRLGLGNLIIGYDEDPVMEGAHVPLQPGDRGGSHNLVIGRWNRFTRAAYGGLVAGEQNAISNEGASVSGGRANNASGYSASVSGGVENTASGQDASVTGVRNIASGAYASVSGGGSNIASGDGASVSGGYQNTASGYVANVNGGYQNTAGGRFSVVLGGTIVVDNKDSSIAPQPPFPNYP
jgi:hypothetical protein